MVKILLAEDDENLNFVITDHFEEEGFEVTSCKDGLQALKELESNNFDLAILDVMMPRLDGFNLAIEIRKKDEFLPIIFLTARSLEEDRLKGFEIGADDYLAKPFSMKELIYRVRSLLKRATVFEKKSSITKELSNTQFDQLNLILTVRETAFNLTEMEGKLFHMLLSSKNNLVKRSDILIEIWGEDDYFKGRSLDVFVSRLRKYLKADESLSIKNHHGVGFTLLESTVD